MHGIYDAYRITESPSIATSIQNTIDGVNLEEIISEEQSRLRSANAAKARHGAEWKRSQFADVTSGFQMSMQPPSPWGSKTFEQDFILLIEFSEIEGPKPLVCKNSNIPFFN